jgi:hypothetical protein
MISEAEAERIAEDVKQLRMVIVKRIDSRSKEYRLANSGVEFENWIKGD